MGRNLGPAMRRELENLDKDADTRKSAMKALKSYIKELELNSIPRFLAQVSEKEETLSSSTEHRISLYEVLARVHGSKIVPQIDNIMETIIKTLKFSNLDSVVLHQSCSKVVSSIARYSISPTTPINKKKSIVYSLCKPLSDSLLVSQENLSCGAALCLKNLVDSDNWRFASNDTINEVCQRVTIVLDKPMNTNSHMSLVMALAKHNSMIAEAYARLLIQSALKILNAGVLEGNAHKRVLAVKMVSSLMRYLDPKSVFSELELVIEEMEKCRSDDQNDDVKIVAFEALQMAKRIVAKKASPLSCGGDQSPRSPLNSSPESRTVDSFVGYDDYLIESPTYKQRSSNRRLWRIRDGNGGVDVSLKDGVLSELNRNSQYEDFMDNQGDYEDGFSGFLQGSSRNGESSTTPNTQRSSSHINGANVEFLSTPRKLIRSVQDQNDTNSNFFENRSTRFRSHTPENDENTLSYSGNYDPSKDENLSFDVEQFNCSSECVSSTRYIPTKEDLEALPKVVLGSTTGSQITVSNKDFTKSNFRLFCSLFIVIFALFCWFLIGQYDEGYNLVPT